MLLSDVDKHVYTFIENIQKKENSYKLITTIPDLTIDAKFNLLDDGNYELSFTLQPEELKKEFHIDYFFERPFLLVAKGMKILVQNYDILEGTESIANDIPCNFRIKVKAFKGDIDDSLWENSKQFAYYKYDRHQFEPFKAGFRFNLTTKAKDDGFYNAVLLNINNTEILFYFENITSEYGYFIFKSKNFINLNKFQNIINSTITAYAFLNGYYMPDTVYLFAQKIPGKDITYRYENLKLSFYNNAPIVNWHSYVNIPIEKVQLSSIQFNNLVNLFYNNEEYQRSALLLINAGKLQGCAKASLGAVSLETITTKINTNSLNKTIIEDKKLSKGLRFQLIKTLQSFTDKLTKEQFSIFKNKLNQINNKPNASKLEDVFEFLNIELDDDEKYCLNCRNLFLHGNLPRKKEDFKLTDSELLDIAANRLVMLSSILLLKMAGYNGYVIDKGMTEVKKWRMIRNYQKVPHGDCLREISNH